MSILPLINGIIPIIPTEMFGFNLTGWAWLTVFISSVVYLFFLKKINFPLWIWLPWIFFLVVYVIIDFSFLGLQLTLQYLVSLLVGVVISGLNYNGFVIRKILRWFIYLILFNCATLLFFFIRTYGIEDISFGASQVMTLIVAAVLVLAIYYVTFNQRMVIYFWILSVFPIIQVTRMGIVLMFAIAPLHFANKKIKNKILMGILVLAGGIAVFYSDSFQKKSFYTGKGEINELVDFQNNNNFDTSGRKSIHNLVKDGIAQKPIWGHGPRADLHLLEENQYLIKEVHNDYLSVQYNYGMVGLVILLASLAMQFIHLYLKRNKSKKVIFKISIYSALTLFIPMLGFMYSDNLLKYSIYFGNFHFVLIGLSYALLNIKKNIHANISRRTLVQQKRGNT